MKLILVVLLAPVWAWAQVQVAFLEARTEKGEVVQLEEGGRFYHVAISYKDGWLHAYPRRGVEKIAFSELKNFGEVAEVITVTAFAELSEAQVEAFLGKEFDFSYSWSDDKVYCSELVAKLLGLEPKPMQFSSGNWPAEYQELQGELGISPDDVYQQLRNLGFAAQSLKPQCEFLVSKESN